jgi:hypothetical protein
MNRVPVSLNVRWSLQPGQRVIVDGQAVEFVDEHNGNIVFRDGRGREDVASVAYVEPGCEGRTDGKVYCRACDGYCLPHSHEVGGAA